MELEAQQQSAQQQSAQPGARLHTSVQQTQSLEQATSDAVVAAALGDLEALETALAQRGLSLGLPHGENPEQALARLKDAYQEGERIRLMLSGLTRRLGFEHHRLAQLDHALLEQALLEEVSTNPQETWVDLTA
jgi:hypothetical protein